MTIQHSFRIQEEDGAMGLFAIFACVVGAAGAVTLPGASHDAPPPYAIAARMPVGGEGGWDYLTFDAATHRLFVARSSHVQVVDTARDTLIGDIPNTRGVHGVALVPEVGHGFTSNGRDSTVTVFDLKTLGTLATVRLPARNPDAIIYEPVSKRVFTFNGGSASATAIDPATNQIVGSVALGGRPEFAVADGKGRVFVNLEDSSAIASFDAASLQVLSRWPLAPGEEPTGLAMDREHRRLFAACSNRHLIVMDAGSGRRVADLPIGDRVDGVAFDPALHLVLSTNGDGTLSVIRQDSPDRYTKIADVPTQRGARTVALDEATHRVYTCTAQYGETPTPTAEEPRPRPKQVPGSFVILALDAKAPSPR
jgi:DNA-binding beta-propeller fold protein YncE